MKRTGSIVGGRRFGSGRKPEPKTAEARQAIKDVSSHAREHALTALDTLVALCNDPKASAAARAACAIAILDRGYGKPPQLTITATEEDARKVAEMSTDELKRSIADIRARLGAGEASQPADGAAAPANGAGKPH